MFKFIHTADIHLDSPLEKLEVYEGAPVGELRQATRRAFENLVDLAIAERVAFVLIAGDLYDGDWKDYNTGLYFVSRMRMLQEAGIAVYIITGNHDAANKITKTLRLPEGVHFFPTDKAGTVSVDEIDVAIHGQGFATPAVWKDLSAGYPPAVPGFFNIGVLHTSATGREGHEKYAPCTLAGLESKGYDYWALGHVHKREMLREEPVIVFPGNIQGRHIRETGPKGCMLVTVDDSGRADARFRPLDVIRWARCPVDASEAEDAYALIDLISGSLRGLLEENEGLPLVVRIEISGLSPAHEAVSEDRERWINEIRSAADGLSGGLIWVEKVQLRTSQPPTSKEEKISDGPVGEVIRFFEEVRTNPDNAQILGDSLKDLVKKLPMELKKGDGAIALDNNEWLSRVLEQVRPMLLNRLISKRDAE